MYTENNPAYLLPQMANHYGFIASATRTDKTMTLKVMAEYFSTLGIPLFFADVKEDLASLSVPGVESPKLQERLRLLNMAKVVSSALSTIGREVGRTLIRGILGSLIK
ncbi:MAG: DUF853 domain-containing protein [Fusobacteria bacterium]|nr:DUF853 domain-containing protein [Fusobacteriota bacterium]